MTRSEAIDFLLKKPASFARLVGFSKLTDLHNGWIVDMVTGQGDKTLQAHRGSYKTTCDSVALAIIMLLFPKDRTLFMRKTDDDVKEVVAQVKKIIENPKTQYIASVIYGSQIFLTVSNATQVSTNLLSDVKGTVQLTGMGMGTSLTGKHFDRIFTDDIVNVQDRLSKAERDRTKSVYQELQNIKNRGGRIYNTGTPWHRDDAFSLMPNPEKWDCYSTGLIGGAELADIKGKMTASLFSANYELRHIAAEDVIFSNPQVGADPAMVEQGECHIDAAYGGEDYSAFTICRKHDGKYYVFGKMWRKHIDDCLPQITKYREQFNAGRIWCEDNGDKGYLAKELKRLGERAVHYHETTNKFLKITSYLKFEWKDVIFVAGTDDAYIQQILDYNENAEHDDAPDSLASMIRLLWKKQNSVEEYTPILG